MNGRKSKTAARRGLFLLVIVSCVLGTLTFTVTGCFAAAPPKRWTRRSPPRRAKVDHAQRERELQAARRQRKLDRLSPATQALARGAMRASTLAPSPPEWLFGRKPPVLSAQEKKARDWKRRERELAEARRRRWARPPIPPGRRKKKQPPPPPREPPRQLFGLGGNIGLSYWEPLSRLSPVARPVDVAAPGRWEPYGLALEGWAELSPPFLEIPNVGHLCLVGRIGFASYDNKDSITVGRVLPSNERIKVSYMADFTHYGGGLEYHFVMYKTPPERSQKIAGNLALVFGGGVSRCDLDIEIEDSNSLFGFQGPRREYDGSTTGYWFTVALQGTGFLLTSTSVAPAVALRLELQGFYARFDDMDEVAQEGELGGLQLMTLVGVSFGF